MYVGSVNWEPLRVAVRTDVLTFACAGICVILVHFFQGLVWEFCFWWGASSLH